MKPYTARTHKEMEDVLMNTSASGPDVYYHMMRGGETKSNITVWETGAVGKEYVKSYGHYHVKDFDEIYTILQGEGILILQSEIVDDSVESFKAIKVKAGDKIHIPLKMGHLMVNTGSTWLVTSDNSPADTVHADYSQFKKMHGAAYYVVIEENGIPALVKNPNYKNVPTVTVT